MPHLFRLPAAAALAILLATSAQAALTADQVWLRWLETAQSAGVALTADSKEMSGDVLTLTGLRASFAVPDGDGAAVVATLERLTLTEQADGSVVIAPSSSLGADIEPPLPPAEGRFAATLGNIGLVLTAQEDAGVVSYDYTAQELKLLLDFAGPSATTSEGAPGVMSALADVTIAGLAGRYTDTPGANRAFTNTLTAERIAYDVSTDDTGMGVATTQASESTDNRLDLAVVMPATKALMDISTGSDFAAVLNDGFGVALRVAQGGTTGKSTSTDPLFPLNLAFTAAGGDVVMALSKSGISFGGTGTDYAMTLSGPMIPVPEVKATIASFGADFALPVSAAAEAQEFKYVIRLEDLALNPEVWGLFDPGALLPRDPATVVLDLTGQMKWLHDLFGLDEMESTVATPLEIYTAALNELTVTIGGARLAGSGAFTFDNTDTTTFDGMPAPTGKVNLTLDGGYGLIDKLVQLGLLPEDQATGARVMLGMFARPGGAEDSLTSEIEVQGNGSIIANGQKIR